MNEEPKQVEPRGGLVFELDTDPEDGDVLQITDRHRALLEKLGEGDRRRVARWISPQFPPEQVSAAGLASLPSTLLCVLEERILEQEGRRADSVGLVGEIRRRLKGRGAGSGRRLVSDAHVLASLLARAEPPPDQVRALGERLGLRPKDLDELKEEASRGRL